MYVQQYKTIHLEEYNMGIPKRKTNIEIYKGSELTKRRQELLDNITKSDTNLPDSILHDDLDRGMLDYVTKTFKVVTDGKQIPIIDKILTIQRWGEFMQNWSFTDDDGNMQLPFIATIRKPDVQFGTNPAVQRTIPDRYQVYYASVPNWNGSQLGADIYTIPQPIPVDITYDVTIICNKFRDLNKFNKIILRHFASRQDYTMVKGHYIPIVLDKIEDNSPIETIDGRRFYVQNYQFTMLGYLIDSEEFEVKPAINRLFTMFEFIKDNPKFGVSKVVNTNDIIQTVNLVCDGIQSVFDVGESIGTLFGVYVNDVLQTKNTNYLHIAYTSKIEFVSPYIPTAGSKLTIVYYKSKNSRIVGSSGTIFSFVREEFQFTGSGSFFDPPTNNRPMFDTNEMINSVVTVEINGLAEQQGIGFIVSDDNSYIILSDRPSINSNISVGYLF